MTIWAIADLHLSFGVENKKMDLFGEHWKDHALRIESHWRSLIQKEDLVLMAGDISWAMRPQEALLDLQWIDRLPGTKVMIRGNHDYWWASKSKVQALLPPTLHAIHHDIFMWQGVAIGGARLWDTPDYQFGSVIDFIPTEKSPTSPMNSDKTKEDRKIFERELQRLQLSLQQMPADAKMRIAMTHYPPIGLDLQDSEVSLILEEHHIQHCVFGHLHAVKSTKPLFGVKGGVHYHLTACDYLNFKPLKIA